MTMIRIMAAFALVFLVSSDVGALAQTNASPPAPAQSEQLLSAGQLDALLAPIALYPDTLIAEILMASTYPLEVVEAARWAKANANLSGDRLKAAVGKRSWDESVKSLTATPSVLQMVSDKLDWTQKLGDAVLAQQPDVMDAIQRLREKAETNGKLASNKQQTVTTQQQGGKQVIIIEPTEPDTVYVPYYDPGVAYGPWPYPAYPPYYFAPPNYIAAGLLATGLAFGAGYALGSWAGGGYRWGGGVYWGGGAINVNRAVNINNANLNNWTHDPVHRQGVRYNNADVAQRFGARNIAGAQERMDFRGRSGQQVLQPGTGARPNAGSAVGGERPNVGNINPGNRPNVANRPNVGDRQAINRPAAGNRESFSRPPGGFNHGNAFGDIMPGNRAMLDSNRGFASLGGAGMRPGGFGAGGFHSGGFGGGFGGGGMRRR